MENVKIHHEGWWESEEDVPHLLVESICNWIIKFLDKDKNYPLHDFGCGLGHYLAKIKEAGYTNLTGYEGKIAKNSQFNNIVEQDISKPFQVAHKGNIMCLEVGEHIPAEFENIFLTNLANACDRYLILSWAERGLDFPGHVNCLDNYEVIPKVLVKGFEYLPQETMQAKIAVNDYLHLKSTMIFKKII